MALMPVADALARVLARADALAAETVPLDAAFGRVLASDLAALRTQPPDDVSAMDGYAVRAADVANVPATLKVIGEVAAGHPFDGEVKAGASRAHLHRRRDARGQRHRGDPGKHHARRRHRHRAEADRQRPQCAAQGHRFHARRRCCCAKASA